MRIVTDFVEQGYTDRIQQFTAGACPLDAAKSRIAAWSKLGATTVFMAGVFDLPTPSHRFALAEARLMAAALILGIDYDSLTTGVENERVHIIRAVAVSNSVRLVVSADTDDNVAFNKGFQPEKGACPRPILGWGTRAHNLASYSVPYGGNLRRNTVDYITRHGVNACQSCKTCVSRDNALMVAELCPTLAVVNIASVNTVRTVLQEKEAGRLPATLIALKDERDHQFMDAILGGHVSTTSIVQRIKQTDDGSRGVK